MAILLLQDNLPESGNQYAVSTAIQLSETSALAAEVVIVEKEEGVLSISVNIRQEYFHTGINIEHKPEQGSIADKTELELFVARKIVESVSIYKVVRLEELVVRLIDGFLTQDHDVV